jgi:hypothetical protein
MQDSRDPGGGFPSLELVLSLKKKSNAVPRVSFVCLAPGGWASSRTRMKSLGLQAQASSAPAGERGQPAELRMHPWGSERALLRKRQPFDSSPGGRARGAQNGGQPIPAFS